MMRQNFKDWADREFGYPIPQDVYKRQWRNCSHVHITEQKLTSKIILQQLYKIMRTGALQKAPVSF